jgi:hypothetical protein
MSIRSFSFPRGRGVPQRLPPPEPPDPPGVVFFASKTTGNDTNPGTKLLPWQTLTKASTHVWAPGETLALKANDVWTGEAFLPQGNGTFDSATYNATYSSVLASAQAGYLGSSVFSNAVTILTAAGNATPTATATEYCRRLAVRDAVRAAFSAADLSSSWVRVTRYDTGVNPAIAPGGAINAGILFSHAGVTGGWKIYDIDIRDCQVSGIDCEPTTTASGLWIERCRITNIVGMPLPPGGADNSPQVPGFFNAWPLPVSTNFVHNVMIRSCTFSGNGAGPFIWNSNDSVIENCACDATFWQPAFYVGTVPSSPVTRAIFSGNTVTHQQSLGWPNGTAGLAVAGSVDFICDNNTITDTTTSGDGVAFDFEAQMVNSLLLNNRFINNQGSPTVFVQSGNITGTMIVGNHFENNGLQNILVNVAFARTDLCTVVCMQNTTVRAGVGTTQKLFSGTSHAFPPNVATDTVPTFWTYGTDNTVSPP